MENRRNHGVEEYCRQHKNNVFYSQLTVDELKALGADKERFNVLVKAWGARKVHIFREDARQARKIAKSRKVPFHDALHAVVTGREKLTLITDDRHFEKLQDITHTVPSRAF